MKKLAVVLQALFLALCLTGCGGREELTHLSVIAAQYGPETTRWWVSFEQDFERSNPGIDLVVDVIPWKDLDTVINARIEKGRLPDILNIDVFADYQAQGLLLPAKAYVSPKTYNKLYPAFLQQSVVDGAVWAIPNLASARALFYNKDLLEEAGAQVPSTWQELRTSAQTIADYYQGEICPWGVDMTTDEGQACFAYYTWNNGGGFVDEEGNWTLNSPENVEAVEFITRMISDGLTNPAPDDQNRYDLQELFAAGKLAMMIGPNQIASYCESRETPVNFGIAAIPRGGDKPSVSAGVMDRFVCFDNQYSQEEYAAITAFFDFFYEDERYADWVLMEDFLPATAAGAVLAAAADPSMAAWIEIVGSCQFYPTAKAQWAQVKQGVIEVQQQALRGGDVQQLLDALQASVTG